MKLTFPILDDLNAPHPRAANGAEWRLFTDRVMGGVSNGTMTRETVSGRAAIRMRGDVSLENNGGFIQISLDLVPGSAPADARAWAGIEIDVLGRDEDYSLRLRTTDLTESWQSYRQGFVATPTWTTVRLPFAEFTPHRTEAPLDLTKLRRIGVVAIGRAFSADLAVGGVRFFA